MGNRIAMQVVRHQVICQSKKAISVGSALYKNEWDEKNERNARKK